MTTLYSAFLTLLLWCARFELAIAMSAPNRNYSHISALRRDVDEYERALILLQVNL